MENTQDVKHEDITVKDVLTSMKQATDGLGETAKAMQELANEAKAAVEKVSSRPAGVIEMPKPNSWTLFIAAHLLKIKNDTPKDLRDAKAFAQAEKLVKGYFGEEAARKALETSDINFLPEQTIREIEVEIDNQTVGRSLFRSLQVSANSGKYPLSSVSTAYWVSESAAPTESEPTLDNIAWDVNTVAAGLTASYESFNDFALVESLIRDLMLNAIAEAEDKAFLVGSGSGEPSGIYTVLNAAGDTEDGTGDGVDVLLTVWHQLKDTYKKNAVWFMNETTLGNLMTQKDSNNAYYFGTLPDGFRQTIFGRPVYTNSNIGANIVLVGDATRYLILDKVADGSGKREMGFNITKEGKTLVSTRSIYLQAYDRLDGFPVYKSASPAIKPWRAIINFLQ